MRKLFWQISTTLDGYMEGPGGELADTARYADPEFDRYASQMLQAIGGIVLGRATYELFAAYWPTASGADAERINALPKFVCSKTLYRLDWANSQLIRDDIPGTIARLKQQEGGDLALFGSADLASTLMRHGLIDEYRLLVSPVVLGRGRRTFRDIAERLPLRLSQVQAWSAGLTALYYQPA